LKSQYGETERIFKTICEDRDTLNPLEGCNFLKDLYLERGQIRAGLNLLQQAVEKSANDPRMARDILFYNCLINAVKLRSKKYDEVLTLSAKVIKQATTQEQIYPQIFGWYHHGLAALHLNDPQKAREMGEKIKQLLEKFALRKHMRYYLHLMGVLAQSQGEYQKAVDLFTRAISLLPSQISAGSMNHARFMESRARVYAAMGQIDKAISEYQNITRLTTGRLMYGDIYAMSYYRLGQLYQKKGWHGKAFDNYRIFLKIWQGADPDFLEVADATRQLQVLQAGSGT
jgi:tetratricopeptide (TPR) repeat protein